MKLGNANANSGGIVIPAMNGSVASGGSDVTLSFRACPWCEYITAGWTLDNPKVKVVVSGADGERTITDALVISDRPAGGVIGEDGNAWKSASVVIPALKPDETIRILGIGASSMGGRFLIDEISVVKN